MSSVDEIRGRLAAATPATWSWYDPLAQGVDDLVGGPSEWTVVAAAAGDRGEAGLRVNETDAALIANAPADPAFLFAEVDRLTALVAPARPFIADEWSVNAVGSRRGQQHLVVHGRPRPR